MLKMATLWNKMNNKGIYVEICKMMYLGFLKGIKYLFLSP